MEDIKPIIDRLNKFFENHTFEVVTQPTHDENHNINTNVKVEITGMKEYIRIGEPTQYIQYTLKVSHFNHTQSFAGRINEDINYDIFVEVGRHQAVEDLLNNLASNAGVPTVQAFGA